MSITNLVSSRHGESVYIVIHQVPKHKLLLPYCPITIIYFVQFSTQRQHAIDGGGKTAIETLGLAR